MEAKSIAIKLKFSDRIEKLAKAPVYVTLEVANENFQSKPSCRLIKPSKTKLGKPVKLFERKTKKLIKRPKFQEMEEHR